MKLVKPEFQIIEPTGYTIDDIYKSIELAGRVSHKSEDKITETSAKDFVGRMLNMKHLATCEFGTVYLYIYCYNPNFITNVNKYINNNYSECIVDAEFPSGNAYISTNYRVLVENNWLDDLKYLCEPTKYHYKRYTVKFICDRAIANEFIRHRKFSFLQESTRYCRYSDDKFNNELTFIEPCWLDELPHNEQSDFISSLGYTEDIYIKLTEQGWKAEEARNVLPLSLKTELYMCGFAEDWKKFFELRCASNAHPQAKELAIPLKEEFIKRGYINE
jgi:thymidylate synthase (FAD)